MYKKLVKITFINVVILLFGCCVFAKNTNNKGFKTDEYGTSYYYENDKFYNDGWHLVDINYDNVYEYMYFTITGHVMKETVIFNQYLVDKDGCLMIDDSRYQANAVEIVENNVMFNNKIETSDEVKSAFIIDFTQQFDKWYNNSYINTQSKYENLLNDLSSRNYDKIDKQIDENIRNIKKIASWYQDKLYDAKKDNIIDKTLYTDLRNTLQSSTDIYKNKFRNEWKEKIDAIKNR